MQFATNAKSFREFPCSVNFLCFARMKFHSSQTKGLPSPLKIWLVTIKKQNAVDIVQYM